jgi:hypothetical protein
VPEERAMDPTLTVIAAAVLIWIGVGRPSPPRDGGSRVAASDKHQVTHSERLSVDCLRVRQRLVINSVSGAKAITS